MKGESDKEPVTVETLRAFLDAFNRHDLDAIMEFFADDCTLYMPRGPEPWGQKIGGKERVREGLAKRFEGVPDAHYGDDRHWVSENGEFGVSEWLLTGTTPQGGAIEVRGADHLEFKNGEISRKDSYWKIVE